MAFTRRVLAWRSVLVVVALMCGVPVPVVHIVQVVAVQDGGVATSAPVHMGVRLGRDVHVGRALVVVIVVPHVHVAVMEIVDVAVVPQLDMATVLTMVMIVAFRLRVLAGWALVVVPVVGVVLMPVVDEVDVPDMLHGGMPAAHPVDVGVLVMDRMVNRLHARPPDWLAALVGRTALSGTWSRPDRRAGLHPSGARFATSWPR
jgi:hypothetical protein